MLVQPAKMKNSANLSTTIRYASPHHIMQTPYVALQSCVRLKGNVKPFHWLTYMELVRGILYNKMPNVLKTKIIFQAQYTSKRTIV